MSDLTLSFNTTTTQLSDDIGKINGFNSTWFHIEGEGLLLGKSGSDFKTKLDNQQLVFLQGSDPVTYISNQRLYISQAVIENSLSFGSIKAERDGTALNWVYVGS